MNPKTPLAALLYGGLTVTAQHPGLAVGLSRLGRYGEPLHLGTEILIEGFPRSGNSFAVAAFCKAQKREVDIAHHLHAPGHVIAAVRSNVPALVVIRHPDEAVLEFASSKPNIPVAAILRGYIRFYQPLRPFKHGFVTATFEQVHADLGAVIRRVNERFWTAFLEFVPNQGSVRAAHRDVERDYRRRQGSAPAILGASARQPATEREEAADRARRTYQHPALAARRARARTLYDEFAAEERSSSPAT
jgi:hypothetical protein